MLAAVWCGLMIAAPGADRSEARVLLLRQAKAETGTRYDFAIENKVRILPTADERSFYLLWYPPGAKPASTPLIVTLHGSTSWAFDEFHLWKDAAEKHGCGIAAVQWWFGEGDLPKDYYRPEELYPLIAAILQRQGTPPGQVMLHGFNRGAANTYALTFLDRRTRSDYFRLTVANAGGAATGEPGSPPGFPLYADITRGTYGTNVFAGSRWVLYAGELDTKPERDGPPAMTRTAGWLRTFGGTVDRLIIDPRGVHGSFQQNAEHLDTVLKLFKTLRTANAASSPAATPLEK